MQGRYSRYVTATAGPGFGTNSWLVEEMYEQFRADPESVGEAWREFFADYKSITPEPAPPRLRNRRRARIGCHANHAMRPEPAGAASASEPPARRPEPPGGGDRSTIIRGTAAVIAANMERSLSVPTATSFREIPAKLLEVNRKVINGYRSRSGTGKVSFTHLIGYAIVRAIADAVPNMRNTFVHGDDGKPRLQRNETINLGLAVDVAKGDGTRTLVVPVVREADRMDFAGFLGAYEELIRKVRSNKLTVEDFQGANVSLTNPGTIGTVQSVPRLMQGQSVIVGVGRIDYPAEFEGADRANLSSLGVSKVVTITSTYDHRIIQGAESGMFLARVHELLLGEHEFYDDVFHSLGMPYEAVKWRPDVNPIDHVEAMLHKQMQVATLIRVYRVRGHLIADLDPLKWKEPAMPKELDPLTYGLTIWDLDREFLTGGVAGTEKMQLGALLGVLRDAYCRTIGIEYMHIQDTEEQRWIQSKVEGVHPAFDKEAKHRILERLNAAEAFEKFLATKYVGTKRFGLEGSESAIAILDGVISAAADAGLDSCVHRHGPPRPAQRAVEHHRQELRRHLPGVRGARRSLVRAGLRRRQVPPRCDGQVRQPVWRRHPPRARRQPQPPGDGRPDRRGHGPGGPGPDRPARLLSGPADPLARRRRLRGAGRRGRDAGDERHLRISGRRHRPPHHQQPDRVHDRTGVRPVLDLLQ